MKKLFKVIGLAFIATIILTGCRTSTVQNVQKHQIENKLSSEKVYKAIKMAGLELGWTITKVKDGLAKGQINLRDHEAVVEIPYSTNSYSIIYKDSKNLKYNAEDKTIHSNYNGWVQNLRNKIDIKLTMLSM